MTKTELKIKIATMTLESLLDAMPFAMVRDNREEIAKVATGLANDMAKALMGDADVIVESEETLLPKDKEFYKIKDELSKPIDVVVRYTPYSSHRVSIRTYNVLKSADLRTVADMAALGDRDILKFRGCGRKGLSEIYCYLEDRNIPLGIDPTKYGFKKSITVDKWGERHEWYVLPEKEE